MYLLDTNVLLKYPSVISHFDGEIALSIRVIEEIDGLKKNVNPEVAYEARRASHKILKSQDKIHFELKVNRKKSVDDSLIELAKKKGYILVTNDLNVIIKCNAQKVQCQNYDKVETNYTGVQYISAEFDENLYNADIEKMLDSGEPPMPMRENEFLIVKDQEDKPMCNLIFRNGKLELLNGHAVTSEFVGKIVQPLKKTI